MNDREQTIKYLNKLNTSVFNLFSGDKYNFKPFVMQCKSNSNRKESEMILSYIVNAKGTNQLELAKLRESFFCENNKGIALINKSKFLIKDEWKIAFIGGSNTLRIKIKEEFPSFKYISPYDFTRDLTFLKNMDYIFIHTHMPHSMFYKIIDMIRLNKIKYTYLNEINIDILKEHILINLSNMFNIDYNKYCRENTKER